MLTRVVHTHNQLTFLAVGHQVSLRLDSCAPDPLLLISLPPLCQLGLDACKCALSAQTTLGMLNAKMETMVQGEKGVG